MAAAKKASPFHVHLTVFQALLFRLTGEQYVCIGMADAGRTDEEDFGTISLLLNLLPLRFGVAPSGRCQEESRGLVLPDPVRGVCRHVPCPRPLQHHSRRNCRPQVDQPTPAHPGLYRI